MSCKIIVCLKFVQASISIDLMLLFVVRKFLLKKSHQSKETELKYFVFATTQINDVSLTPKDQFAEGPLAIVTNSIFGWVGMATRMFY